MLGWNDKFGYVPEGVDFSNNPDAGVPLAHFFAFYYLPVCLIYLYVRHRTCADLYGLRQG